MSVPPVNEGYSKCLNIVWSSDVGEGKKYDEEALDLSLIRSRDEFKQLHEQHMTVGRRVLVEEILEDRGECDRGTDGGERW